VLATPRRVVDELTLFQLSVISAPVIGGPLEVTVKGSEKDGHKLDVLAVEDVSAPKILKAGLFLLLGVQQPSRASARCRWTASRLTASVPLVSPWAGSSTEACRAGSKSSRGCFP
jgi:hypothetical protein